MELATKILKERVDFKKSMFKHKVEKVTLFGSKLGLADLERIREEQKEASEYIKKTKAKAEEAKKYLS